MYFSCNKLVRFILWGKCGTSSVYLLTGFAKDALQRRGEKKAYHQATSLKKEELKELPAAEKLGSPFMCMTFIVMGP